MKLLLCTVPVGPVDQTVRPSCSLRTGERLNMNLGIMRIIKWLEKNGYTQDDYDYYDIANVKPDDVTLKSYFKEYKPDVVGISAPLSFCYPKVKALARMLRELFPDIWIVVGGNIASSARVILHKTDIDLVVVGDGEIGFLELMEYFKRNRTNKESDASSLAKIAGLAFLNEDRELHFTGYGKQVPSKDLEVPDFELLKRGLKVENNEDWIKCFFTTPPNCFLNHVEDTYAKKVNDSIKNLKTAIISTSVGCVARCTFCQRYIKGYRVFDCDVLDNYIQELKDKYAIEALALHDENFGSNKKQAYQLARIFKKHDLVWFALGVRCTSTTYEDLKFYKEHGLAVIKFGIESGSERILELMEKRFTPNDVLRAIEFCKKLEIACLINAYMVGMPGETSETIKDTADHFAKLRFSLSLDSVIKPSFWALAVPGTPLYEYCRQVGIIGSSVEEEEDYLNKICNGGSDYLTYLNKTDSSMRDVVFWNYLFCLQGKKTYRDLVLNSDYSFMRKLKFFYKGCILSEILFFKYTTEGIFKKDVFLHPVSFLMSLGTYTSRLITFLIMILNLFTPRFIIFPLVREWSNLIYHVRKRKNISNLVFSNKDKRLNRNLVISNSRLDKIPTPNQRSIRSIVKENRKIVTENVSDAFLNKPENKAIDLLLRGQ